MKYLPGVSHVPGEAPGQAARAGGPDSGSEGRGFLGSWPMLVSVGHGQLTAPERNQDEVLSKDKGAL